MKSVPRFLIALFTSIMLFLLAGLQSATALAASSTPISDFTDNGDGSVTHKTTGLTWKRCSEGQVWTGSGCSGTAKTYTLDQAMALGSSGWGVPTIEQLRTIVDIAGADKSSLPFLSINSTVFPNMPEDTSCKSLFCVYTGTSYFWSASAYEGFSDLA